MIVQEQIDAFNSGLDNVDAILAGLVADAGPPPPAGNWAARSTAPGVVRSFRLDTLPPLGNNLNYGISAGTSTTPVLDIEPDGVASVLCNIPGRSGPNASGTFYSNNAADLSNQCREGMEYFWQIRTKWNRALCETVFIDTSGQKQGGVKLFDVTFGDEPTTPIKYHYSSAMGKVIVQNYYQTMAVQMYAYDANSNNSGFHEYTGSDWKLQNAMPSPYCLYSRASGQTGPIVGCFGPVPDEWMTWKLAIALGPVGQDARGNKVFTQARRRLWGQRGSSPSQLLIDFKPGVNGYFDQRADDKSNTLDPTILGLGKMYAMAYITNKDPLQDHALCQARYREYIVSTQDIADAA